MEEEVQEWDLSECKYTFSKKDLIFRHDILWFSSCNSPIAKNKKTVKIVAEGQNVINKILHVHSLFRITDKY